MENILIFIMREMENSIRGVQDSSRSCNPSRIGYNESGLTQKLNKIGTKVEDDIQTQLKQKSSASYPSILNLF